MIYTSIEDMPIYNWFKCIDTKDYSYCSSERKNITEDVLKECEIAFNTCYDEFIYTFGISPELAESGEYKFDSSGANKATEAIAKHLGFFEKDNKKEVVTKSADLSEDDIKKLAKGLDEKY